MVADSALASTKDACQDKYKSSNSFKNDALEFAQVNHRSTLAHEWLTTDAREEYLLAAGKEDFYSRYSMMQQEINAALKAKDLEFTPAGYGLCEWLPPLGESSSASTLASPSVNVAGHIPLDHDYLNSTANL